MRSFAVIATTLAVSVAMVKADYIEEDDIPRQCQDVCRPVWQASARCNDAADGEDDDDDNDGDGEDNVSEVNCICSTQNFNNVIPECELCVRPYYPQEGDYDTIRTLLGRCNFPARQEGSSSASATGMMTTMATQMTSSMTTPMTSTMTTVVGGAGNDNDDDNDNNNNNNNNNSGTTTTSAGNASPTSSNDTDNDDDNDNNNNNNNSGAGAASSSAGNAAPTQTDSGAMKTALPMAAAGLMGVVAAMIPV